jgi:hypothetical protein
MLGKRELAVVVLGAATFLIGGAGVARAVSGGPYVPSAQGCPANADASASPGAVAGCHDLQTLVSDGSGHNFLEAGLLQLPVGANPHGGTIAMSPNGAATPEGRVTTGPGATLAADTNYQPIPPDQCGAQDIALYAVNELLYVAGQGSKPCTLDPAKWNLPSQPPTVSPTLLTGPPSDALVALLTDGKIYLGADDNLNSGEHDGVDGKYGTAKSVNGPSDGGAVSLNWQPLVGPGALGSAVTELAKGRPAPLLHDPFPLANAGGGACADGICFGAYSNERVIYRGGGGGGTARNVYDYSGKVWGPYDCNSGSVQTEQACLSKGGHPMDYYRQQEATNVNVQPGLMLFEDADPQGSPILPTSLYPLPAAYIGTCGVVLGGAPGLHLPSSPLTNQAGQLAVTVKGC